MRVHFLASTLARGGAETMAVALSRCLVTRGHSVRWTLLRELGELGETLESGFDRVANLAPSRRSLLRIDRLRDRLSGDEALYVLDHDNAVVMAAAAAPLAGVRRKVVAIHTTGRWGGKPSLGTAMKSAARAYDAVLALSPVHAKYLVDVEGVSEARIRMVPNGIDPARFADLPSRAAARTALGLDAEADVIGVVAMLRPEKNHALLLEAASGLVARHPRLRVVLVGDGPERDRLEERARATDLDGRVRFAGSIADVPAILPAFDLFVLPSFPSVETQPVSVLEAMTAGVPVIATRVGDVPALLDDGEAGVLIESEDCAGLAAALERLLDAPAERERLSLRGKARALRFTLDASTDALERVLAGVVA